MKVRWSQGSLRLRVTPMEMAQITRGEAIAEDVRFPGGAAWRVLVTAGSHTSLASEGGAAQVTLSAKDREDLAAPEAEGVYFQAGNGLRYYVEKDFPCAHPRAAEALEPVTETFDAPAGFEERKAESEIHGD